MNAGSIEYKEAIEVLKSLVEKRPLDNQEKEAAMAAMGVLSWVSPHASLRAGLSKSRIKILKAKRDGAAGW